MPTDNAGAQETDATVQSKDSAPDNKDGKNNEVASGDSTSKQHDGIPAGLKRDLFNLREKSRTKDNEIAALRAEIESIKAQGAGKGKTQKVDPLEDPEGYRASTSEDARAAARDEFNALLSQHSRQASAVQAESWLLSRSHIADDGKAAAEVAEIIATEYPDAKDNPRAAARSAYLDWCEKKGVTPDISDSSSLTPPRHAKLSSAGAGSSKADKTYTPDEVAKMQISLAANPAALAAYNADVVKAAKEGRYKGNAIHFQR